MCCIVSQGGHDGGGLDKGRTYQDKYPTNLFFPLAIEVFECLHQQVDNFLHCCANMAWVAKGLRGLSLSILHAFSR